jgi:hypothetical protein
LQIVTLESSLVKPPSMKYSCRIAGSTGVKELNGWGQNSMIGLKEAGGGTIECVTTMHAAKLSNRAEIGRRWDNPDPKLPT